MNFVMKIDSFDYSGVFEMPPALSLTAIVFRKANRCNECSRQEYLIESPFVANKFIFVAYKNRIQIE